MRGRSRRSSLVRYREITHLASSSRGLAIGTAEAVFLLHRREFSEPAATQALEQLLRERIARLPGGVLQLARMVEIDQRAQQPAPRSAVYGFVALCLAVFALERADPFVVQVGSFIPAMVARGELWRLVTANLLHHPLFFPFHMGLNLLCILVIGLMVERVLGSLRVAVVMGVSGLVAMLLSGLVGYPEVIGASGVAAGLAGALLCIELRGSRRLPVGWRIPRRFFIVALLVQATLDLLVPFVAGAAHAGGFLAGYAITRMCVGDSLLSRPAGPVVRTAATGMIMLLLVSLLAASPLARRDGSALERHAVRLIHVDGTSINHANDVAWLLATEVAPSSTRLHAAEALAQRAVERSGRANPDLLDTLAEVLFASGDISGALRVIDEAIALSRGESYFLEQRRRFTGERAVDDRPAPPDRPWGLRPGWQDRDLPLIDPDQPGIVI